MSTGPVVELVVICAIVMAPAVWVSWGAWKTYGREDLLHRITRRCETHDRLSPVRIRQIEAELGMTPAPLHADTETVAYTNTALIDCGHPWCRTRRHPSS